MEGFYNFKKSLKHAFSWFYEVASKPKNKFGDEIKFRKNITLL